MPTQRSRPNMRQTVFKGFSEPMKNKVRYSDVTINLPTSVHQWFMQEAEAGRIDDVDFEDFLERLIIDCYVASRQTDTNCLPGDLAMINTGNHAGHHVHVVSDARDGAQSLSGNFPLRFWVVQGVADGVQFVVRDKHLTQVFPEPPQYDDVQL